MARRATRRARPGGAAGSYARAIFNRVWRAPAIVEAASHCPSASNASTADVARSANALWLGSSIVAANVGACSIALLSSTVAVIAPYEQRLSATRRERQLWVSVV